VRSVVEENRNEGSDLTGSEVGEVLEALEGFAPRVWIDGGWGVDALVAEQTRDHTDLDLVVDKRDLAAVEQTLVETGFRHDPTIAPGLPARLVLRDHRYRQIDIHPLVFDGHGNGWQQLSQTGRAWGCYPAEHLRATGTIAGHHVHCLSPELQVRFRMGYEWSSRDEHDIRLLTDRFDLGPLPPPFWQS
jgi:lincosamide nucleotidyltransferase A/C/D/E